MVNKGILPSSWDLETDIVVVGYGYAGGIASLEAKDSGAEVLLLEKMSKPGGISICSGGGLRTASNVDSAFAYLKSTCGGLTPDAVLKTMAQGMTEIPDYMRVGQGQRRYHSNHSLHRELPLRGV